MMKILAFYIPLVAVSLGGKDIVCPGGKHQCPDDSTCCMMTSGQYGCCPMANAVCCNDKIHCCPEGTRCDDKEGVCIRSHGQKESTNTNSSSSSANSHSFGHFPQTTSLLSHGATNTKKSTIFSLYKNIRSDVKSVVCPGGKFVCPDSTTCCKNAKDEYGCCPLPDAVCCSDGMHCCPSGTECDMVLEKCVYHTKTSVPLVKKQKPIKVTTWKKHHQNKAPFLSAKATSVVCPDGQYECPNGNTCCKLPSGQWGCCPLLKAVCCDDHIHCCPQGTTCDVERGGCKQRSVSIPWLKKSPATVIQE